MNGTMPSPDDDDKATDTAIEGAGGVVFDPDGRVLVLHHADGAWVFPKGHLDPGEDHLQAAVREVREEAGVEARCETRDETWTTEYVNDRGQPRRITWYRLACDRARPVLSEALFPEGEFLPVPEALARLTHDEDRALLRRVAGA